MAADDGHNRHRRTDSRPSLPLITIIKLFMLNLFNRFTIRSDGSPNRRLKSLLDFKSSAPSTALIGGTRVSAADVTVDPSRNLWFRLFTPDSTQSLTLPFIVYYHGGGFTSYGPDSKPFHHLCNNLAAAVPAVVASVNYRLAPEHRYPTQYEDAFDALKFIDTVLTMDLNRCFIAGDSAGGNIAHHVAVQASQRRHEFNRLTINGVLALQPFFGGEERTESEVRLKKAPMLNVERTDWMWRSFLPENSNRDHPAARVFGGGSRFPTAAIDLGKIEFPRVLVIKGGFDPLLDWQDQYVEWLKKCGKEVETILYQNAFHGFYGFPEVPEFNQLLNDLAKFIQKQHYN